MRIAIYAFTGITMFHLSVPQMVFNEVARQGLAPWETVLFSDDADPITTAEGYQITGVSGPGKRHPTPRLSSFRPGTTMVARLGSPCDSCSLTAMTGVRASPASAWARSPSQIRVCLPAARR